eukprot:CAMPEP_0202445238 /NCGR_PEP_ID=MMETSP1360-20130828/4095_1 /ASSEMBLY_ACC=CAM_ASM_000848 /TAXON_ID=515479 /ORGANISM="Licmophora paradoxa, Strain CCMP2313" /LENGTH=312 /DNA_ID=CAMNT_0049061423 /DNA_START=1 /DNA_END=939 /DNA_ORIENTATION=+
MMMRTNPSYERTFYEPESIPIRYRIRLSAESLPKIGNYSIKQRMPDCWAEVFLRQNEYDVVEKIGETENVKRCCSPHWIKSVVVEGKRSVAYDKNVLIEIWRHSNSTSDGRKFVGRTEICLAKLMHLSQITTKLPLSGGGYCSIEVHPENTKTKVFQFQLQAVEITRAYGAKRTDLVIETEKLHATKHGQKWKFASRSCGTHYSSKLKVVMELREDIDENEMNRPIRLRVLDSSRGKVLGTVETSMNHLMSLSNNPNDDKSFQLSSTKGYKKCQLRVCQARFATDDLTNDNSEGSTVLTHLSEGSWFQSSQI